MLTYEKLKKLHKNNADRLAFIDFMLRFTGSIKRADIGELFNLSDPAASKALAEYNKACPGNMSYSHSLRTNAIEPGYEPLIDWDGEVALGMIANGFNKNKLIKGGKKIIPYEKVNTLSYRLPAESVAIVTRAISREHAFHCRYYSNSSNNYNKRTLVPLSILYDGESWMCRAYDRTEDTPGKAKFKFFNFTRFADISECRDCRDREGLKRLKHETLDYDQDWNTDIPFVLKIHEDRTVSEREIIRTDFGIKEGSDELLVIKKAAYWWILKKKWCVDIRSIDKVREDNSRLINTDLQRPFYKFRLNNKEMVELLMREKSCFSRV